MSYVSSMESIFLNKLIENLLLFKNELILKSILKMRHMHCKILENFFLKEIKFDCLKKVSYATGIENVCLNKWIKTLI